MNFAHTITLSTDYGELEGVPASWWADPQDDAIVKLEAVDLGHGPLSVYEIERFIGKAELARQTEIVARWWAEEGRREHGMAEDEARLEGRAA